MKSIFYLPLCLALVGCHQKQKVTPTFPLVDIVWENGTDETIDKLIDSVAYIALEAHPDALFAHVDRLLFHDDHIYIADPVVAEKILVFDSAGRFVRQIGQQGKGPAEYYGFGNFTLDNDGVYLVDNTLRKIIQYGHDGRFVRADTLFRSDLYYDDIEVDESGNVLLFSASHIGKKKDYRVTLLNADREMEKQLFFASDRDSEFGKRSYFTRSDRFAACHTYFNDTIIVFDRNNFDSVSLYAFDFGTRRLPLSENREIPRIEYNSKWLTLGDRHLVTDRYIIGAVRGGIDELYLYDRQNDKLLRTYTSEQKAKPLFAEIAPQAFHRDRFYFTLNDRMLYDLLVQFGWPRADTAMEKHLENGDFLLISYKLN